MPVKPIPDGYHSVTPYLIVDGAERLIEFMKQAFGARERMRMPMPNGLVGHAELEIGDSLVMLSDPLENYAAGQASLHLYVEDVDAVFRRALEAGATSEMEPADQFYGDRLGNLRDAWGNRWSIATHVEDVPEDEMMRRMAAYQPSSST